MIPTRLFLLAVCLLSLYFAASVAADPPARLYNAGFDHGTLDGVAAEWLHFGAGAPVNETPFQGITELQVGESGRLAQLVNFCEPGRRYRVTLEIDRIDSPNTEVWLGLDPVEGSDMTRIVWTRKAEPGLLNAECTAQTPNLGVLLEVRKGSGPRAEERPVMPGYSIERRTQEDDQNGAAWFQRVTFEALDAPGGTDSELADPAPPWGSNPEFSHEYILDQVEDPNPDTAYSMFLGATADLPDTREEFAALLVDMPHDGQVYIYPFNRMKVGNSLGIQNYRDTRRHYPEARDACAFATARLGEFYLQKSQPEIALEFLATILNDYGPTEHAWWGTVHSLNAWLWTGRDDQARETYARLVQAHREGELTDLQMAWAENFHIQQRLAGKEEHIRAHQDYLRAAMWKYEEGLSQHYHQAWNTWRYAYGEIPRHGISQWMERDRETMEEAGEDPTAGGFARYNLAAAYLDHAWDREQLEEGLALLRPIIASETAPLDIRYFLEGLQHRIQSLLAELDAGQADLAARYRLARWNDNLIPNPDFEASQYLISPEGEHYTYGHTDGELEGWEIVGTSSLRPNWYRVDWEDGAPAPGLGGGTPGWSSSNLKPPAPTEVEEEEPKESPITIMEDPADPPVPLRPMQSALASSYVNLPEGTSFRASIHVAADGTDTDRSDGIHGGEPVDVQFELSVEFYNGFMEHLGSTTTGLNRYSGSPAEWTELEIAGTAPEDTCHARLIASFRTDGPGHHRAAMTHASLVALRP